MWNKTSFYSLIYYQYLALNYTMIMTAQDCMLEVYFPEFVDAQNQFKSFAHALTMIFLSIILI